MGPSRLSDKPGAGEPSTAQHKVPKVRPSVCGVEEACRAKREGVKLCESRALERLSADGDEIEIEAHERARVLDKPDATSSKLQNTRKIAGAKLDSGGRRWR